VQQLAQQVDRHGTYLVVTPRGLYGVSDVLNNAEVVDAVRNAASDNTSAAPALSQALDQISSMAASGRGSSNSNRDVAGRSSSAGMGAGLLTPFLVIFAIVVGLALLRSRSRRRRQDQQSARAFAEVRQAAAEDVTRFGEDITGLDLDVDARGVDDATRRDYTAALDAYDAAKRALDNARTAGDLAAVSTALEDGRYSMECVRARMAGRPLPARRPPCFFNPQHGPSAQDVEWAPPGGAPRPVPACRGTPSACSAVRTPRPARSWSTARAVRTGRPARRTARGRAATTAEAWGWAASSPASCSARSSAAP